MTTIQAADAPVIGRAQLGYGVFDADNHYYEPTDCFTRHMPASKLDRAVRPVVREDGTTGALVGDRELTFLPDPFRERPVQPGALRQMLRSLKAGRVEEGSDVIEGMRPAFQDREARLRLMDEQGIEAALLLPTLGVCVEHAMSRDVEQTYLNLRAFNEWLDEDWGFAHAGRIYAPPLLSLLDLDRAVDELERVLDRGARVIHLRPGPQGGRAPGDPRYDPFWSRVAEAGVAVAFHIAESGYNEMFSVRYGEEPNPSSHRQSAFQWTSFYGDRPIMDTVSSLIFYNFFGRYPGIRVLSLENGSLWVPYLLRAMDKMVGMGRHGPWPGGRLDERPGEVFRRHVLVSPYHEEDVVALAGEIGASQVLFGSDYPHPEGLADPVSFADALEPLGPEAVRRIMRTNLEEIL
ncbi:MAG TPA: amidohydrolase family protein [Acidimicrobiales bacterium]|nr:amidohydrolase family protein [Acidimicrobiales bacterium]